MRLRLLLVAALACAALASAASAGPPRFVGTVLNPAKQAPDFALRDQSGHVVRLSKLRGKVVLVTFLYTHCPDVCPLISSHLNDALRRLGPRAGVRVVAVSTDPKGDTHTSVARFVKTHRLVGEFHYLTGKEAQLAPIWRAWHVAAFPGPNATVNHSSFVILVDRQGKQRLFYDSTVTGPQIVHDVRLLGSG
jgi:protein SCO1/2